MHMAGARSHLSASYVTMHPSIPHVRRKDYNHTTSLLGFCACCLISLHLSSHSLLEILTAFECTVLYHLRTGYIDLSGVCSKVAGIKSQRGSRVEQRGPFTNFRMRCRRMPGKMFLFFQREP